jgi:hypothetical protein
MDFVQGAAIASRDIHGPCVNFTPEWSWILAFIRENNFRMPYSRHLVPRYCCIDWVSRVSWCHVVLLNEAGIRQQRSPEQQLQIQIRPANPLLSLRCWKSISQIVRLSTTMKILTSFAATSSSVEAAMHISSMGQ